MTLQPKLCRPPTRFKDAGVVEKAKFSPTAPGFITHKKRTGARAAGLRYEKHVHQYLTDMFPDAYIRSPWFRFYEVGNSRERWCQPDGLIVMPKLGRIIIVEVKLQHTSDAWWQLKYLYLPVIAKAFPGTMWEHSLIEVVRWYDPDTVFPEKVFLKSNPIEARPHQFGVHIWKP